MDGIYQRFCEIAARYPDQVCYRMVTQEEPVATAITNSDLRKLVELASAYLARQGVRQGDTLAMVTSYHIGTVVGILASMKLGTVLTIINSELPKDEVKSYLSQACPQMVIADSVWAEELSCDYQTINTELVASGSFFKHHEFTQEELKYEAELELEQDIAVQMFTSGTTGKAQSVYLTQANLLASCLGIVNFLEVSAEDVVLDITRPFHVTGLAAALATLMAGAQHIYLNDYTQIRDGLLRKSRVTLFLAVPKIWAGIRSHIYKGIEDKLAGRLLLKGARLSIETTGWRKAVRWFCRSILKWQINKRLTGRRFRFGISGGSALSARVKLDLASVGIPILEAWGMTETGAPHLVMDLAYAEAKPASTGKPLQGFEADIVPLPPELCDPDRPEIGELVVRGPNVCKGYSDPSRNAAAFMQDGWFRTGDIAYQDEEGYYYIVDRLKSTIVLATGKNVYPEKLHAKLEGKIPWIEELVFFEGQREGTTVVAAALHPNQKALEKEFAGQDYTDEDIQRLALDAINKALEDVAVHERLKSWEDILVFHGPLEKTSSLDVKAYRYKRVFFERHQRRSKGAQRSG